MSFFDLLLVTGVAITVAVVVTLAVEFIEHVLTKGGR